MQDGRDGQAPAQRTVWEYAQIVVPVSEVMGGLARAGADGWELCGVLPGVAQSPPVTRIGSNGLLQQLAGTGGQQPVAMLILKRPKGPEDEAGRNGVVALAG